MRPAPASSAAEPAAKPGLGALLRYLGAVPTGHYILAAILLAGLAGMCNGLRRVAFDQGAAGFATVLASVCTAVFVLGYGLLWALLVLGPFRPHAEFTLRGHIGRRIGIFLGVLAALLAVHAVLASATPTLPS